MDLRAVIIDDEIDGIKSLRLVIEKFTEGLKVIAESTDPLEGCALIENYHPDIVFLDIHMPGMDGFELLKKLSFRKFHLVFTTAHDEHALKAIKEGALDYLLKPIDSDDLQAAIRKIRKHQSESREAMDVFSQLSSLIQRPENPNRVAISGKEGTEYHDPDDIIRLEASSNYTLIIFKSKKSVLISRTLKDFEKQVCKPGLPFMRVHQSHIININHSLRYKKEDGGIVEMSDQVWVQISPKRKDDFLKSINLK